MQRLGTLYAEGRGTGPRRVGVRLASVPTMLIATATILSVAQGDLPAASAAATYSPVPASVPAATVSGPVTGGTGIDLVGTTSFELEQCRL